MDTYIERATEQRCADFATAREWAWQPENVRVILRGIAELLSLPVDSDFDEHAARLGGELYDRMHAAVATQPATRALADELEAQAYDDYCDDRDEAEADAAYARACERAVPNVPCW